MCIFSGTVYHLFLFKTVYKWNCYYPTRNVHAECKLPKEEIIILTSKLVEGIWEDI